ncbi:P-loop containing nucleoside triphosphate hydrolase protein [Glomus cerebriforme]|uniref:P-loop containing nucleoside triphosphate hydrolase protein n=1 Tax=Glomus cerebriforme TaxID=658196 RepID=A0A397TMH2_9GLOM|nr:P-loop containing nucleoside triphosphate hydrolase protein [Glomus cerebriforme]
MSNLQKVEILSKFIVDNFNKFREITKRPLIVGLSGTQGCGKTTVVNQLVKYLKTTNNLSVVTCSIDDFLLTYKDQCQLSNKNLGNKLLEFRGQPGTHDVSLGKKVLQELCDVHQKYSENSQENLSVSIPNYDKSLQKGRGDRSPVDNIVIPPFDIILFDGWSLGFKHLSSSKLKEIYYNASSSSILKSHLLSHLEVINENLKQYEENWYPFLDIFICIESEDINNVYSWRLEQEHNMKRLGKDGMSDEQVKDFVDRYMPGYELYLERLCNENFFSGDVKEDKEIYGRHLKLVINHEREIVKVILF